MKSILWSLTLLATLAAPAAAQTQRRPPPPPSNSGVGIRAYGLFDFIVPAATKSFDAVFGSGQLYGFGGGAEVDLSRKFFLRFAVSRTQRTGSRVFVDDTGDVFTLDIPMTVTMTPIEAGAGLRFPSKNKKARATPYIGGAFISLSYQETSALAQSADDVSERYTGGEGFGGVAVKLSKSFFLAGEAQYRYIGVPDVSTSVMTQFGDKDLGGFTARVLIGFSTK